MHRLLPYLRVLMRYTLCRLLFHRIRPIFVFDGATPPLKRRTTIARRRCGRLHRMTRQLLDDKSTLCCCVNWMPWLSYYRFPKPS